MLAIGKGGHGEHRQARVLPQDGPQRLAVASSLDADVDQRCERSHAAEPSRLGDRMRSHGGEAPVAQRLGQVVRQGGVVLDQRDEAVAPGIAEQLEQTGNGRGLGQYGEQALVARGQQIVLAGIGGHDDGGQPGIDGADLVHEARTAHHRHAHVGDEGIEPPRPRRLERLRAAGNDGHLRPRVGEDLRHVLGKGLVVIHDQVATHFPPLPAAVRRSGLRCRAARRRPCPGAARRFASPARARARYPSAW